AAGSLFCVPRGVAVLEAHQRFPRFSPAQGRRKPTELNRGCGKLPRIINCSPIALRFLQTSQNEFPVVIEPVRRDIRSRAILHRYKFLGFGDPKTVSGTCARKEGLRTLTSPRRE